MSVAVGEKISFLELAKRVIEKEGKPMTRVSSGRTRSRHRPSSAPN
jgi:hypothetical protein